jgi:hypothetical protein
MYVSFKMLDSIDYSSAASVLYNAVQIFWIRTPFFADLSFFFLCNVAHLHPALGKGIVFRRDLGCK